MCVVIYELLSLEQVVGHKTTATDSAGSLFSHFYVGAVYVCGSEVIKKMYRYFFN